MKANLVKILCVVVVTFLFVFTSCLQAMRVTSRDIDGGIKTLWLDDYELGTVGSIPNATVRGTPGYEGWPTDPDGEWVTDDATPGAFEGTKYLEIFDAWGAWIFDSIGYGIVQMRFAAYLPSDTGGAVLFMFLSPWDGHQNKERCRFTMNPNGTLTYLDASLCPRPFKIAGDGNDMIFTLDQWHVYVLDYNTVSGDMQLTVDGVVSQNVPFAEHHADARLYGSVGLMWPFAVDGGHVYMDYAPPTVCGDKYLLMDIAGPGGAGMQYRDRRVNFFDLAVMAQQWLVYTGPSDTSNLAQYTYMDYLPTMNCGDAGTIYSLADIAGPGGVGIQYRDCRVNFFDFVVMAQQWLVYTDSGDQSTDLTLLVTSDTHFGYDSETTTINRANIQAMNSLMGTAYPAVIGGTVGTISGVIVTGDLTQSGYTEQWDLFEQHYPLNGGMGTNQIHYDVYECTGNHDWRWEPSFIERLLGLKSVKDEVAERHGDQKYDFELQGIQFYSLDKYPTEDKCEWLAGKLAAIGTQKPVVLFLHFDLWDDEWWSAEEQENFRLTIDGYNIIAIIHGHKHDSFIYNWCGHSVFSPGSPKSESLDRSFGVLRIQGNTLAWAEYSYYDRSGVYIGGHWEDTFQKTFQLPCITLTETK